VSHVLVVCARRYNGHELWTALGVIKQRGHTFELISTDIIIQDEITMRPNKIKRLVGEVAYEPNQFDGLMIVSGNMADTEAYWKDDRVLKLFDQAEAVTHPIAAICCSVPTARNVAKGKKVSFFPLVRSRALLQEAGAILTAVTITRDQNLVTAENQMGSQMWAEEFCNMLEGKEAQYTFVDSNWTPQGRERMPIKEVEDLREKMGRQRRVPHNNFKYLERPDGN
jgi:putative intracellular protease/amidase